MPTRKQSEDEDSDEPSGVHDSPESVQLAQLLATRELRRRVDALTSEVRRGFEKTSPGFGELAIAGFSAFRGWMATPVWPGRFEMSIGFPVAFVAIVFFTFGADKAWWVVETMASKLPRVTIESSSSDADVDADERDGVIAVP